ncbi:MAG: GH116 family glycosyl-hydrolase [Verrucomicrobiota bacterium]
MNLNSHPKCSGPQCGCGTPSNSAPASGFARRDFLRLLGASGIGALTFRPWEYAMAGPFTRADFEKLVPRDKKLSPEWIQSLTARGKRNTYRGTDLARIGMPIGGICAGQLYLGGDGNLWHWDIFNREVRTKAEHYAHPMQPSSPLDQGFALRINAGGKTHERTMDAAHWSEVSFTGEYPIGYVNYADPECPVSVSLEAFSPFIPLNTEDSSLPATVMEFTLRNSGTAEVEGELAGWLENAVCLYSGEMRDGLRRNRVVRAPGLIVLQCSAEDLPTGTPSDRPDIVFENFESENFGNWSITGTAFGSGPVEAAKMPRYQRSVGAQGERLVNSHASAPGKDLNQKDDAIGQLLSRPFPIERNYITFLIGGGKFAGKTCVNLLVDNKVVLSATGANENRLRPQIWDVREWAGKTGQIEIVDNQAGPWGNIGVDDIVFCDRPRESLGSLAKEGDFGTMGLALLNAQPDDQPNTSLPTDGVPLGVFSATEPVTESTTKKFSEKLAGSLARKFKLAPGQSTKVTFVITWFMPNLNLSPNRLPPGRHYATQFDSARSVAAYVAKHFDRLASQTRLWHDTWYDSTLPFWFLDRTFLNTSTLATSTCFRFGDGRFYSWEGVGCWEGTCSQVWPYAQSVARIFPELERILREKVDLGLALQPDGAIHFRGEFNNIPAVDGQAGVILRALREHQMSADAEFLKRNWPRIRKATEWLIAKDANADGLLESNQHNTLDADWYGKVAWLSGLYLAALNAAATMADEVGDPDFARQCRQIFSIGQKNIVAQLFDSDYFMNKVDPKHLDAINSGTGCEIDQVMGQSWAFQVGLPRVFPERETRTALGSIWRYNFAPVVGPYREAYKPGRWYAMPGEAGLLMCTFPRTDWDYTQAKGNGAEWAAGYFNECMNGFEYQVAGHMLWEGMITEGLAVTRAVHDRYHASRRNPWNEVECGDHYVRSMASYGVYLAACGFEYHGPNAHLGFAPKLAPENFKSAFTSAAGWGTFSQKIDSGKLTAAIVVRWGQLRLKTLSLTLAEGMSNSSVKLLLGKTNVPAELKVTGTRALITLSREVQLAPENELVVALT